MSATPLAGLRVLEFSHTVMGPTVGLIFAELGADVIKVEPAPQGDHTRGLGGFAAGFFAAFSRNKRSLAVDLKLAEGRAVIHRLIPTIDLVLENYGPGTVERLGCGYDQLAALNPRLIYLALKGYLAGPYEHRPALDEVVQFQTGLAFMTGPVGRRCELALQSSISLGLSSVLSPRRPHCGSERTLARASALAALCSRVPPSS
jgi:crotonobetainyl-CoA:carnitine CoA-transferase CaiB-like acyl-CoA transferase